MYVDKTKIDTVVLGKGPINVLRTAETRYSVNIIESRLQCKQQFSVC